jgi:transcriptional regulator with XRE-family HTH domain
MVASMFTPAHAALAAAAADLRKRAGLTQRQLADALGREQSYVGRIETGQRRVDLVEWVTLCRACGADPEREVARLMKHITGLVPHRGRK